ncbi:uncharacterized protein LOC143998168 isoform X2 [Lithobates pipiens]
MTVATFNYLLDQLHPRLQRRQTNIRRCVAGDGRLLVTLRKEKNWSKFILDINMANNSGTAADIVEYYSSFSQEERRKIIVQQLLARYPARDIDRAFPVNPTVTSLSVASSASENLETNDDRIGNIDWCQCQCCIPMATQVESVCCQETAAVDGCIPEGRKCITEADIFSSQIATEEHVRLMFTMLYLEERPVVDADNNREGES